MIIRQRSCTFRYRVVQVIGVTEQEWGDGTTMSAFAGSGYTREFKTLAAAQRYQNELAKSQRWPVMLQVGCMQWLSDEEAGEWSEAHVGDYWE